MKHKPNETEVHPALLHSFYRSIINILWQDVEAGRIPPNLISGISRDLRKVLYS